MSLAKGGNSMNKQNYETLEMEIIAFETEDVIQTSNGDEAGEGGGF